MATRMYVDKDVSVNQRFGSILEHNYHAKTEEADFGDTQNTVNKINKWVSDQTHGRITDLVNEGGVSNSIIILLNALYFGSTWRQPFQKTFQGPFNSSGKSLNKKYMDRIGNYYYFNSKLYDAKFLRIPYIGHRYSMFIILPNESTDLDTVVNNLNATTLKNEVWHMDEVGESVFSLYLYLCIYYSNHKTTIHPK